MRLAMFSDDVLGPVARHRCRALFPHLRSAGFDSIELVQIPDGIRARAAAFSSVSGADLVLVSRKLFTRIEFMLLRRAAKRLVFDFDDAVCHRDSTRGRPVSHVRMRRFRRFVRGADLVTAGSGHLAALARGEGAQRVVVVPTAVDAERYRPRDPGARTRPGFRVGWIGSRSTRFYLGGIAAALRRVAAARSDFTFAVLADQAPSNLEGVPVEFTPWSESGEVAWLQSLDAGVMPLPDDPWTRGKCGFKLLQYMACGVPSAASPVGVNPTILARGGGALCSSDDEWVAALLAIGADPEAARLQGAAGRAAVLEEWSTDRVGPAMAATLREAALR